MGIFHKQKWRISYDTRSYTWDVHEDYGMIFRDWWLHECFNDKEAAEQYIEEKKLPKPKRLQHIEYR